MREHWQENMPNPIDMELGEKLRVLRMARQMTQEEVAEALGLGARNLNDLENGTDRLTAVQLVELADLFGIGAEEFLYHFEGTERAALGAVVNVFERLDGDSLEFAHLFSKITNARHRSAVLNLARSLINDPSLDQESDIDFTKADRLRNRMGL